MIGNNKYVTESKTPFEIAGVTTDLGKTAKTLADPNITIRGVMKYKTKRK